MSNVLVKNNFKNILVVRTDRMGDVSLTTPVIGALRQAFPSAHLSMMVTPHTKDIVEKNPSLDSIVVLDRSGPHKNIFGLLKFILELRAKKFDVVFVLHTKRIINLICFFAGIPLRVGYQNDKYGFLLTHGIKDTRAEGTQHEIAYCLDVLRYVGIPVGAPKPFISVTEDSERWVERFYSENKLKRDLPLVAVHPGASCVSKRWAPENFVQLINGIQEKYPIQIVLVGNGYTQEIISWMIPRLKKPVVNLSEQTTVGQLISVLKRSKALISNDSGPVHVASCLGVPVLVVFGRNQAGLNPKRWGPISTGSVVIHKDVGCTTCLAHNCEIQFKCLEAVKPQEVLQAFDSIYRLC